jgi:hypothetical protein
MRFIEDLPEGGVPPIIAVSSITLAQRRRLFDQRQQFAVIAAQIVARENARGIAGVVPFVLELTRAEPRSSAMPLK